ncbi:MAG: DUF3134 domain-containing protein [Oscillatoria sp. PMC 1051.18]|uniref:DUF3134 domain-containing protein n=1 Tax=Oscillatoria salina TaxID=331517 RepID=UPI0013B70CDF|nr:DUF3134 domain-containing protein [Oscillatoria salina]MBZ8182304.1 DUF3134 domain-containing protein [Oscillatoria salina IIICB1]MEC4893731.1 DUF3134 domain-containing protein [Oscillatoria sp. PMC 1050.18]MEC5030500.1 DUF3134 domain-containing protein [Oscillatoria sp. PMC 1051.18]NET90570.1 DUF3134 domain-containing protein [Kamptonema sp. SIO1D9]
MYNPSLRQEPRYEPASVIPLKQETSLLDWLESEGRLIARQDQEETDNNEDEEEIAELMDVEDSDDYDIDEDDEDLDDLD